jgi:adenosyl cobinamide kinase/adenosyl cobinamide phosphate guanylyltransferase
VTTALIIVCIVFCVGIVVAIVGHLGGGIASDKTWRQRIRRHHARRGNRGQPAA